LRVVLRKYPHCMHLHPQVKCDGRGKVGPAEKHALTLHTHDPALLTALLSTLLSNFFEPASRLFVLSSLVLILIHSGRFHSASTLSLSLSLSRSLARSLALSLSLLTGFYSASTPQLHVTLDAHNFRYARCSALEVGSVCATRQPPLSNNNIGHHICG
jgi:hypothetical protein